MKKIIAFVLALVLAFAAMFSLAACDANTQAETTTTPDDVVNEVVEIKDDFYEVDWELSNEELQKQFLKDFESDKEVYIEENTLLVRVGRCFRIEYIKPKYTVTFIGSVDVPASKKGWSYNYEEFCHPVNGCTFVINGGKVQSWTECQLNWEVEIPNYEGNQYVAIADVYDNYVLVYNASDTSYYLVYDQKVRKIESDVLDIDFNGKNCYWLTTSGEVYLWDYLKNPDSEATLVATDAIAITHSDCDAPGWYIEGEVDPEYMGVAPVKGKFVPIK